MLMDYITYYERIKYLISLIEKGNEITPLIIAEKFDCCEKTARNMVNKLRVIGYKIDYCKVSKKYIVRNISDGNNFTV